MKPTLLTPPLALRLFAALSLLLAGGTVAFAQCDKPVVLTASKTEYLDQNHVVQRTVDEMSKLEISKTELARYEPEGNGWKLDFKAEVTSSQCDWKVPFKEGKSILKVTFMENGETKKGTITIEGKNGKVTLLAEIDDQSGRKIRVAADSFEHKK